MNLNKKISLTKPELLSILTLFILIVALTMSTRLYRLTSGSSVVFPSETEIILTGTTSLDAAQDLFKQKGIQFDDAEMDWAANLLGWRNLQRGRYLFEGKSSFNEFLSKMARGIQDPVSVVILPGSTAERLASTLDQSLSFDSLAFAQAITDSSFLASKALSKEQMFGRMLPNTYLIYWTITPKEFINKVLREFDNAINQEMEAEAEKLGISIDEAVTLASIVEWEAKNQDEKDRISGLYWNRLNRGMRLQADPTVNYAVGERRRLLFEDYQIDHPFNTYMNRGLPPGPITNPSLSTIKATLYPEKHDYLYMVANPEGGHVFTKTFREHQIESEKWRIWLREQYRIKRQREAQQSEDQETR